jgi:hypothetical protein
MANISITDLRPTGAELFDGHENYFQELSEVEFDSTIGGMMMTITCLEALFGYDCGGGPYGLGGYHDEETQTCHM